MPSSRRCSPLTPYDRKEWVGHLASSGLEGRYPHLLQGLTEVFERTYTPPNHPSLRSLIDVYNKSVKSEFMAGHYIDPSLGANWNRPWALFSPPLCPLFQKCQTQAFSVWFIIFLTCTTPPLMRCPSTHTSIMMISPAHGAPSPQSHYSFPTLLLVPKHPYATWQRHTEQFLLTLPNGPGWSSNYKQTSSLQLTPAITLASPWWVEYMACWLMQEQTFSKCRG